MKVSEIMTREVVYAGLDNTFSQVRDLFLDFKLHHLPIVDNENLIGIISTNDVIRVVLKKANLVKNPDDDSLNEIFQLDEFMTKSPINIAPDTTVDRAVKIFNEHNFQALPVVEMGKLVGIITLKDIINHYSVESVD